MTPHKIIHLLSLFYLLLYCPGEAMSSTEDAVFQKTLNLYLSTREKSFVAEEPLKTKLRSLSYTQSRLLRSYCQLPEVSSHEIDVFLERLPTADIKFAAAELLDDYIGLNGASGKGYLQLLERAANQSHVVLQTSRFIARQKTISSDRFMEAVEEIISLPPSGQWVLEGIVKTRQLPADMLKIIIDELLELSVPQQWTLEKLVSDRRFALSLSQETISSFKDLSSSDTFNVRAIFENRLLSPEETMQWLDNYFLLPLRDQENRFKKFDDTTKEQLLSLYETGAPELIHEINRLHDVTDSFGREIGNRRLRWLGDGQLTKIFARLHPVVQNQYKQDFNEALSRKNMAKLTEILHKATHESQKQLAAELTGGNLFILISEGSRVYTSAFRELLVPLLQKRVEQFYGNNFLLFLQQTDPRNRYSAPVITHLARRGQLSLFMPREPARQQALIQLVADSAFASRHSLLEFSASFTNLFLNIDRQSRSHFIDLMLFNLDGEDVIKAELIQMILEHYLAIFTLDEDEKKVLREKLATRKKIEADQFSQTPFNEWLADDTLSALSVFHSDDDGYGSFVSNNIQLLENGYQPSFSTIFNYESTPQSSREKVQNILQVIKEKPYFGMNQLFNLSSKSPIVIEWKKRINGKQISHSTTIYHGQEQQRFLLKIFLDRGFEMYCQRGHSYWLRRQLQIPLTKLMENKEYKTALLGKERFISLGSCGSIGAYFKLGEIFAGNVTLLATVGTGTTAINNEYNRILFELAAGPSPPQTWNAVDRATAHIFDQRYGEDYILPDSLPALLQKLMHTKNYNGTH